jgi:phosphoribosylformylglycinamidine synthase
LAITDCLNFGDPERTEVWHAMAAVVAGMRDACLALETPIISGNVSLYNETDGAPIAPSPIVGALGLIEDVGRHARAVAREGQELWLLGPLAAALGASEYAAVCHGWSGGQPSPIDLDLERRVQACVQGLVADGTTSTATDVAEGGLAVALAELALAGETGFEGSAELTAAVASGQNGRADQVLFGEAAARVIVGIDPRAAGLLEATASHWQVPTLRLGLASGSAIQIGEGISVLGEELRQRWEAALDRLMEG